MFKVNDGNLTDIIRLKMIKNIFYSEKITFKYIIAVWNNENARQNDHSV